MFAAWSRVRRSKQPAAYARKELLNRHLLERPSSGGPSRQASRVIAAGTARWSHWAARCRIKPTTKVRPNSRTRPLAPTTWAYWTAQVVGCTRSWAASWRISASG